MNYDIPKAIEKYLGVERYRSETASVLIKARRKNGVIQYRFGGGPWMPTLMQAMLANIPMGKWLNDQKGGAT